METEWKELRPNPKETANPLNKLFFGWTIPIFKKGFKNGLEIEDLYTALKQDRSENLGDILERHFMKDVSRCAQINKEKNNQEQQPSLGKALAKTFWKEILYLGILSIFNELIIKLSQPIVLGKLLEYFRPEPLITHTEAMYYGTGLVLLNVCTVFSMNHYMVGCFLLGMRARIAVCSLIYRKSLRLSRTALGESAPGKVVNLLSNDVNRFDLVSVFIHYLWIAPVSALLVMYFLYINVGYSGLLGTLVVFTVMPVQAYAGKLSSKFRLQTAMKTDERVRLMGEIISGIQVIKMYAWEKPFQKLIEVARRLEIKVIRKTSYVRAVYMTFLLTTTRIAVYACIMLMYFLGDSLTATKVFVVSSYFNVLSSTVSAMFVRAIAEIAEFLVALKRLQKFLHQEEFIGAIPTNNLTQNLKLASDLKSSDIKVNGNEVKKESITDHKHAVKISKCKAQWLPESMRLTLDIDTLNVKRGRLIGVIGPIGSGKSSLLQMILGELPTLNGTIDTRGTLSYACQEPWVFGGTIRQNILFGQPYEKNRYNEVVRVCALLRDFTQFTAGDQTLIGERGTSLSGGQKARVNLARAVYRQADIYLMDDPLSAVDAHVGRHLFETCMLNYLRGKTRILVTHQLHYLKDADHIIILKDGKIEVQGTYSELLQMSSEFTTMLVPIEEEEGKNQDDAKDIPRIRRRTVSRQSNIRKDSIVSRSSVRSGSMSSSRIDLADITNVDFDDDDEIENKPQRLEAEASSKKNVKGSVLFGYVRAGVNYVALVFVLLLFLLAQFMASGADYWMSFWTSQEELRDYYHSLNETNTVSSFKLSDTNETQNILQPINSTNEGIIPYEDLLSSENCYIIYSVIIVLLLLFTFIRSISFYDVCMKASQKLHDMTFRGIVRSPLRFFNTNPSGRIMNRFSKDMGAMDEVLPKAILDSSQMILQMFGAIILSCYVNPIFVAPVVVLLVLFAMIRRSYLKSSKDIKRLEGIHRSPVFTHLNATLQGLPTIRAFGAQTILKKEFDWFQNTHTSTHFLFVTTSSAFGLLLDLFCIVLVAIVIYTFLLASGLFGDKVGLAVTQVMSLTFMMQWGIRQSAEVANQLMAVERVLEYTQLPVEKGIAPDEVDLKKMTADEQRKAQMKVPPRDWPEFGLIQINDLLMKYSELPDDPYVLKGLNCTIKATEKIGIVGRTGAGKSSIISAMFRLAYNEGEIVIDNVNTEDVYVGDLRKKISIIPQDPVLFSGTLRRNLDPFEEYSDDALWNALDEVELKSAVDGPAGLEGRVMDEGSNFSVGQRQLICLARAILRNNRILMLDEATANVDPYTDNLIQKTIREKFAKCTVLTVAHRLNTIMDSDKVLVMDGGKIVEFEHAHILLQNKDSILSKMAAETGPQNVIVLEELAQESYNRNKLSIEKEQMRMIDD